jgi:hypothetical protein
VPHLACPVTVRHDRGQARRLVTPSR